MALGYVLSLFIYPGISPILLGLFLIPANVGQGMGFPSSLFSFIFAFPQDSHATSTSTLYLIRSIGSLFGVGGLSAVIQSTLRKKVFTDLSEFTDFNENQIREIIHKVTKSMSSLYYLPEAIQKIVLDSHATSTSTLYLIRSIGSLFGVGGLSAVIQSTLRKKVFTDLSEFTDFNENQIREIIHKVTKSMSSLYYLPEAIQKIVLGD
ncbi:hypothetical protein SPOG_05737 [Schizosaccharomyces cryophilus OY26]|uniref:Uncharacterized protein n=1 Tax=Schizosaccharomyces cryophilus (strain OY26 / ATCC MYA-4695 / CBS 11777 / NBRC 106824 / NRRL Y48691) TaxID=653667 RepID=S9W2I7_SCHCR|nr:uncharacterized protein SPOG_05737 [Schizosaccharomyces cryophilus OY26]EPY52245.1 hypothetical protein SPOG_05737 [Schizosaccharomyces cryophilus OY26]